MATYPTTAAERFARARQIREERFANHDLNRYLQAQPQAQPQAQANEEDYNWLERTGATAGDVVSSAVYGILGGVEGLVDLGIGVVGAIGGIFDDDFEKSVKDVIEYNATHEWVEKPIDELTGMKEASYLGEDNIIRDVSRAIGGMLPGIAVSVITANPAAGIATIGASAAGSGTQEAYAEGADFYEGLGYGTVSGAIEAGTEALFGGVTSKFFGKGALGAAKSAGKEIAETGAKRVIKGVAEEAAEEAVASAVNPLAKTIYKGSDALEEYASPEFYQELGKSALLGGLTAGAFGGLTGNFTKSRNVQEIASSISNLKQMQRDYRVKDTLTDEVQAEIVKSTEANLANMESILKKMPEAKRAEALKNSGMTPFFDADGTLHADAVQQIVGKRADAMDESDVSREDRRYVSPELWSKKEALQAEMQSITEDLRKIKKDPDLEEIEVYKGDLDGKAKTAFKQLERATYKVGEQSKAGLNLVLVNPHQAFSGAIKQKGNTLYIAEDALENGTWAGKFVHEVMHFAEKTKEYAQLFTYLEQDEKLFYSVVDRLTNERNGYGFTAEDFESLIAKREAGETLNETEQKLLSEIGAHLAEEVLGNEAFIKRIAGTNASLARRILEKIKSLIEAFRTLGNKEAREQYKKLRQAEVFWNSAMETAGIKYKGEFVRKHAEGIGERSEEREEENGAKKTSDFSFPNRNIWSTFGIKAINDYVGVQKAVLNTLEKEGYFSNGNNFVVNQDSGMEIEITKKGIKETLGKGKRFKNLPRELKELKLETIRSLPNLIQNATLKEDNVPNYHNSKSSVTFAYLTKDVDFRSEQGDNTYEVTIVVKQSEEKNKFWIHEIRATKNEQALSLSEDFNSPQAYNKKLAHESIVPQDSENVNSKSQFSLNYKPTPKDPDTAYIVQDWGEDTEVDQEQPKNRETKPSDEETATDLELAEENARRRDFNYSEGQKAKKVANRTNKKVYTQKDASEIVSAVIANHMNFGEVFGNLNGKSRKEIVHALWKGLNSAEPGKRAGVALDIAEYILQTAVVEDAISDPANDVYRDTVDLLRPYVRKLDLDGIRDEIRHKYDKKAARIYSRWGKRNGTAGISPDVAAMELASLGFQIEATHPADILFEMEGVYQKATEALQKSAATLLKDGMSAREKNALKQDMAREILDGFSQKGSESEVAKTINRLTEQNYKQADQIRELKKRNTAENRALDSLQRLKKTVDGDFKRASEFHDDRFKQPIGDLAKIATRNVLNEHTTRTHCQKLLEWYNPDNSLFRRKDEEKPDTTTLIDGAYQEDIRFKLEAIANGKGKLSVEELDYLRQVADYFRHMVETFNKVWKHDKYVEAEPLAKEYVNKLRKAKRIRIPFLWRWFESGYNRTFSDPLSLMKYADKYQENGFYTDTFREFERAVVGMATDEMELMEKFNQFLKEHKDYKKRLEKGTITYHNSEINVDAAIYLYMVTKVPHAWRGLVRSGFKVEVNGKQQTFANLLKKGEDFATLTDEQIENLVENLRGEIRASFTEEDLQYLDIVERILNEECSKRKEATDMMRLGYSNVTGLYYCPIMRANTFKDIEKESFWDAMDRVGSLSMNKDRVTGASGELLIVRASEVLKRHVHQVAMYSNLAIPVDNYNRLYNLNVGDNAGKPDSLASEGNTGKKAFYTEATKYLRQLIFDAQGKTVDANAAWFNEKVGMLRGGYAKFQLGANPKVWLTQLSSFIAAANILDPDCIAKGIGVRGTAEDVVKYSKLAKHRRTENTTVRAQSVSDKIGKTSDVFMTPIGWVDSFVINRLYGACQLQIAKDGGAKLGTEENKKAAAELLDRVILDTQQNSVTTAKSAAMRSSNELLTAFTMFSSDSMKMFGRFMDAVGEKFVLRSEMKLNKELSTEERAAIESRLKRANNQLTKSTAVMVASAAFMALLGLLFRSLYRKNKDKEPSEIAKDTAFDALGNMLGGLPILRDIYTRFSDGYELDVFATSLMNDLLDAVEKTTNLAQKAVSGTPLSKQEVSTSIRDMIYATSQLFGMPTRNAFNLLSGITGIVNESAGYYIDDLFYKQPYKKHLQSAVENEDERMIATITGLMIDETVGSEDAATRKAMSDLLKAGHNVLPRSFTGTITNDGEEIDLNRSEKKRFEKIYSTSDAVVADLVKLQTFQSAEPEAQAKAIRFVYDTYYNLAKDDLLGTDTEEKNVLFAQAIDVEKLALIASVARSMKADTDKKGNTISGSRQKKITAYVAGLKLTAVEKYMIMGYLGYTNANGRAQVQSYINTLNLSDKEKKKLLEYSGYKKEE